MSGQPKAYALAVLEGRVGELESKIRDGEERVASLRLAPAKIKSDWQATRKLMEDQLDGIRGASARELLEAQAKIEFAEREVQDLIAELDATREMVRHTEKHEVSA